MNSLLFYLGTFYILVGTIYLTVPLIYLELGKPKDLIRAFLNLLIGLILIIKNKTLDESFFVIFIFLTFDNSKLFKLKFILILLILIVYPFYSSCLLHHLASVKLILP